MKMTQIGDTPLSISIYSVEETPTIIHDTGILETVSYTHLDVYKRQFWCLSSTWF